MSEGCKDYSDWRLSRRKILQTAAVSAVSWLAPSAISQIAATEERKGKNTVVIVFLRGGMDGLNAVAPYADDDYHKARPNLHLNRPGVGVSDSQVVDLDGFFGLHPKLASIAPLYKEGKLAIVHAVGSQDQTRSHFEAMNAMDRGLARSGAGDASGWIARYLRETKGDHPLRAVSFSGVQPDSLKGATSALNLGSLTDYRLANPDLGYARQLADRYAEHKDEIGRAGVDTLHLVKTLNKLNYAGYRTNGGAIYPDTDLGNGLRQSAFLVKGKLGVEVVALDTYGWDTHVTQGAGVGPQADLLSHLGKCLEAFAADMGRDMDRVTVLVKTEFGRRVEENAGLGTDHGRGSCMFLLGGGVNGGKVYSDWPTLKKEALEGPGDLRVTTDYREVIAGLLSSRLGVRDTEPILSGQTPTRLPIFRS